mmetsp:Transcript_30027/g.48154  ORF Transcript_30027/g.48154 Transcript_30027/m.48154 type:complete len:90 (+) Transcript_30027:1123-1392(+)
MNNPNRRSKQFINRETLCCNRCWYCVYKQQGGGAAAGGGGGRTRGIRMMKGGVVVKAYFTGAQLHRVEHNGFFSSVYRSVVNALSSSSR